MARGHSLLQLNGGGAYLERRRQAGKTSGNAAAEQPADDALRNARAAGLAHVAFPVRGNAVGVEPQRERCLERNECPLAFSQYLLRGLAGTDQIRLQTVRNGDRNSRLGRDGIGGDDIGAKATDMDPGGGPGVTPAASGSDRSIAGGTGSPEPHA